VPAADRTPLSDAETAALFADLADSPGLVLAVSGGPDSTALLVLAARWRRRRKHGPKLLAVTVDHGLRPESGREARAVKRLAEGLGVAHRTLRWTGEKPVTGLQQAARAARYRLLAAAARAAGARHVVTAHTSDDQAETVLMRLARGSGLRGLRGMAPVTPLALGQRARRKEGDRLLLIRPLLAIPKARLVATLKKAGVAFADDPSNRDPRFARVRLRGLMPAIAAEGLDAGRLALLARRMARADAALEAAAGAAAARLSLTRSDRRVTLDAAGFADLPAEVALRLVGAAIAQVGDEGPVELAKLEALFAALAGHVRAARPPPRFRRTLAGALVTHEAGRLVVERAPGRRTRIGIDGRRGSGRPEPAADTAIVKEFGPIPLADDRNGPTLALGMAQEPRVAGAKRAAGEPARRKGRK